MLRILNRVAGRFGYRVVKINVSLAGMRTLEVSGGGAGAYPGGKK